MSYGNSEIVSRIQSLRGTAGSLATLINRKIKGIDAINVLHDLFILHGGSSHIRSDNGPEFSAKSVQDWIAAAGVRTRRPMLARPSDATVPLSHFIL